MRTGVRTTPSIDTNRYCVSSCYMLTVLCVSDCPQVQCVEQYVAQQADELSLEPTEIVNVIRKTNEGWYEGSRLSDGQKGWFPDVNVIEITNEHVRRRNIKERYRVSQATRMVKSPKTR
ncbi:hypothetical protein GOODEAATRI_005324 [Goodea atripinnis]|uniref:SH3 domain-containing protein n=1 Tax=Goodea atripinnis TaxID=208336 RepID=A0ABV0MPH7_9TELE